MTPRGLDGIQVGSVRVGGGGGARLVSMDAVMRLVTGVLGDEQSSKEDSFTGDERLLEFSQYTRPREYRGYQVPDVLLSGDHEAIARWRRQERIERTRERQAKQ